MTPEAKKRFIARFSQRVLSHKILSTVAAFIIFLTIISGYSISHTLSAPGSDPVSARLAEWGRDHGLGFLVTTLEQIQYKVNPPKVGGTVKVQFPASVNAPTTPPASSTDTSTSTSGSTSQVISDGSEINKLNPALLQPAIPALVQPAIPEEGTYQALLASSGQPIIESAQLRPDSIHTSYLATVIWISGAHSRFELHPGFEDPGHPKAFASTDLVSNDPASNLIATFNSGFKLNSSRGGFYLNGKLHGVLQPGAASLVTYQDGHSEIGSWGSEVTMTPQVTSVRQNLNLLIDNGVEAKNINSAVQDSWGATLGSKTFVWRSGIGITASGDFLYVAGDALSAQSLANILKNAGAIRAMQLDINPEWISFMYYLTNANNKLQPYKPMYFDRHANRYFQESSRDFYAVYLR